MRRSAGAGQGHSITLTSMAVASLVVASAMSVIWSGWTGSASAAPGHATGASSTPVTVPERIIDVPLRIEDNGVAGFADFVISTLNDPRSWHSAGFRFREDPTSTYRVVLAEPATVDALCLPLRTRRTLSCQNGVVVALNADRWRNGVSDWDASIEDYRRYMVNHEVGHLIGQRHPTPRCPAPGTPAAVMEQQTKGLAGCRGSAWPLWWEIDRAAQRPAVMAPLPDWQPRPVPQNLGGAIAAPADWTTPAPDAKVPDAAGAEPDAADGDGGSARPDPPSDEVDAPGGDAASAPTTGSPTVSSSTEIGDDNGYQAGADGSVGVEASDLRDSDGGSIWMRISGIVLIAAGLAGGVVLWFRRGNQRR